jgi:hypothetical protein
VLHKASSITVLIEMDVERPWEVVSLLAHEPTSTQAAVVDFEDNSGEAGEDEYGDLIACAECVSLLSVREGPRLVPTIFPD